ncbi:hypothetical protein [Echinicola shivajiensis]|uniref:hypothetical protein n=1 Tax=Echinicola shivajiensis TaxID=1035916 RepID=UPI001BFCCD80|nr:hypothetical protein [Echinicola shivajiensis]
MVGALFFGEVLGLPKACFKEFSDEIAELNAQAYFLSPVPEPTPVDFPKQLAYGIIIKSMDAPVNMVFFSDQLLSGIDP